MQQVAVRLILFAVAAGAVAGCSGDSYLGARTVVVQGKFDHLTCEQIDGQAKATQTRIDQLSGLINKAGQESSGTVLGPVVYGPTLVEAQGNLRIYRETQRAKNCPVVGAAPAPSR